MGVIRYPQKTKMIAAITVNALHLFGDVKQILQSSFGPVDLESDVYPFSFTEYYSEEMGSDLHKGIMSFDRLIRKDELAIKKIRTNEIEEMFAMKGEKNLQRRINIDPGYVSDSKLVLASTKNFSHRIYIGQGIFAEVTMRYLRKCGFEPLEWTYPDYKTDLVKTFLESVRQKYMEQLSNI